MSGAEWIADGVLVSLVAALIVAVFWLTMELMA